MYVDEFMINQAFWLVVVLSGVPLLILTGLGVVVGVFQAATQIQEPNLLFVPKITIVALLLFFLGVAALQAVAHLFDECVRISTSLRW